ncbi:MAG: helix-turn-helix domain-containing protein [Nannocystaceae bacterium]
MNHLREYRRALSLTQAQLAKKSGVSEHTICNYETERHGGQRNDVRRKVLVALGLTWAERERVWPEPAA